MVGEPILLALLIEPSWSGLSIGVAALTAFLVRTPTKFVLVDRRRGVWHHRTTLALRIVVIELAILAGLSIHALITASNTWFWVPLTLALPLASVQLWHDAQSRSRHLLPELAGGIGVSGAAAVIILAGGGSVPLALGAWLVLTARVTAAIPYARAQVLRGQGRPEPVWHSDLAQAMTIALSIGGWALGVIPVWVLGALWALAVSNIILVRTHSRPAVHIGIEQTIIGVTLAVVTGMTLRA